MSFKLVKKVISSELVDGMHKLVLVILADYVNDTRGNAAWPSVTTVAIKAGASVRHTRRIIRELELQGVLKTTRMAGMRGTNKYVIDVSGADMGVLPGADIYNTKGGHMEHVRADMGVRRIYKEQIRTDTVAAGAPPGRAPSGSLENAINNSGNVVRAVAHDAPKCTEHAEVTTSCTTCYTWQHYEWRKDPVA